ncbi:hypothetical protein GCM10017608_20980 [Agromyces luteolus]|uniref:Uncharacterized protein n=1 Tax=Agromyces luteolus TaxID=88373 RepID=A0A7C9HJW4_9MICO|nr:hypothetical protein [Agromyces luteolus]MUN08801.1 hypothetical protein [Agromyces luteolus]GLK28164.1 hypothetical protein GCM10017608_20980 [Agromyces luteolus]
MDLAHALSAGGLAGRRTDHRFTADEAEIREAEQRVARRRAAAVERRPVVFAERGRHAAPRTA